MTAATEMWAKKCAELTTENERLRAALTQIASMGDEDNEWDGRDKFRDVRSYAQRALEGMVPASVNQQLGKEP